MKDYLFENFLNWFGREFGSSFYGIGITNFLLHTMSINAKAQGICEHVHWVQNFVSLILSFCSLFFVLFFFFFSFFLFSFEVQILHTWLVCSSWTPFCLFLIQMGSLCNVLSKCTNFGSFCAMIKRKKKMFLSNWEVGWFKWEVFNVYFLSSLEHIFSNNLVSIEHNFLLQIIEKHA